MISFFGDERFKTEMYINRHSFSQFIHVTKSIEKHSRPVQSKHHRGGGYTVVRADFHRHLPSPTPQSRCLKVGVYRGIKYTL